MRTPARPTVVRVEILAHRGLHTAPHSSPENTVRAVLGAVRAGADGVEVDLRVTADGVAVLSHDADLRRTAGLPVTVDRVTWPVLREAAAVGGLAVPRLTDALPALAACRRVVLEVKTPPSGSAPDRDRVAQVVAAELAVLLPCLGETRVTVSSFDEPLLARVRASLCGWREVRSPRRPRGSRTPRFALLGEGLSLPGLLRRARAAGWDEVHPMVADLRDTCSGVVPAGPDVVAWCVRDDADVHWCAAAGVAAVITDEPIAAAVALGAVPAGRPTAGLAGQLVHT